MVYLVLGIRQDPLADNRVPGRLAIDIDQGNCAHVQRCDVRFPLGRRQLGEFST